MKPPYTIEMARYDEWVVQQPRALVNAIEVDLLIDYFTNTTEGQYGMFYATMRGRDLRAKEASDGK